MFFITHFYGKNYFYIILIDQNQLKGYKFIPNTNTSERNLCLDQKQRISKKFPNYRLVYFKSWVRYFLCCAKCVAILTHENSNFVWFNLLLFSWRQNTYKGRHFVTLTQGPHTQPLVGPFIVHDVVTKSKSLLNSGQLPYTHKVIPTTIPAVLPMCQILCTPVTYLNLTNLLRRVLFS